MAEVSKKIDYCTLFKLTELVHINTVSYTFYEVGLKKCIALASQNELIFLYINSENKKTEKNYDWDFVNNPIECMCFEPTGTWLTIVSRQKVILVPFLPLFISQDTYDYKWSLTDLTSISCGMSGNAVSMVWWLTVESENVLIIGFQKGYVIFFSLESLCIVGECEIAGDILDLQICFDDTLDLLALIVSGPKYQQWKLILEHRSLSYNWLHQYRSSHADKEKKEGFISYIKQFSRDKINSLTQGSSKDGNKHQPVEYSIKPVEYLPEFRKGANNWVLTAQYVNGNHFLTAFDVCEGTLVLESPEKAASSRTLLPDLISDNTFQQGLWSQRLVYLLKKNMLEIHSSAYSNIQIQAALDKGKSSSLLWSSKLQGNALKAYLMSTREPIASQEGWKEPTFLCDLKLPRFNLEPCLIITSEGAYLFSTACSVCEWIVSGIMKGRVGAERTASALAAPLGSILTAAADMLLARNKLTPAQYLYELSKCPQEGWLARLGVFGRLDELLNVKPSQNIQNSALILKYLAVLMIQVTKPDSKADPGNKLAILNKTELKELSCIAATLGLWSVLPILSIHRGHGNLLLNGFKYRENLCRGALNLVITTSYKHKSMIPLLDDDSKFLLDYLNLNCYEFDYKLLKHLSLLLCPMQERYRPVLRDLRQGINTVYTTRMKALIDTFINISSALDLKNPTTNLSKELPPHADTWKTQFTPKRSINYGISHWAIVDDGQAKVMLADIPIDTSIVGRVIDIACGRHHTLVLTENGVYASGDNTFGQLGVGRAWPGGLEREGTCGGDLLYVSFNESAPLLSVAAGQYHSAAVDFGGRLFTWGWGVHGQLGLCSIEDEYSPQLVTKLQGRKVLSVSCGICHTVALLKSGEVWCFGAGVFGQLGSGRRDKSAVPVRVRLNDPVSNIAVGHFHNLALTTRGELWTWGASPLSVRMANANLVALQTEPTSPVDMEPPEEMCYTEPHLQPTLVNTKRVDGAIVQIAAGWHHSCLLTNLGTVYTWGLNFDGQLGSGNRKKQSMPTEVEINPELPADKIMVDTPSAAQQMVQRSGARIQPQHGEISKALIVCGGGSTIYVDDEGRIFTTGITVQKAVSDADKATSKIITMKTTKRVIKIPTKRANNKFMFQYIDRIDNLIKTNDNTQKEPIDTRPNPLSTLADFKRNTWADEVIILLKPWIKNDLSKNPNMAAKLSFHNEQFSQCLSYMLETLNMKPAKDVTYLKHTETATQDQIKEIQISIKKEEQNAIIKNVITKRIKDIGMAILNDQSYPEMDLELLKKLSCMCPEEKFLPNNFVIKCSDKEKAIGIIEKCMDMFPKKCETLGNLFWYL